MNPTLNIKNKTISYNPKEVKSSNDLYIPLEETKEQIEAIPASEIGEWIKNKIESLIK